MNSYSYLNKDIEIFISNSVFSHKNKRPYCRVEKKTTTAAHTDFPHRWQMLSTSPSPSTAGEARCSQKNMVLVVEGPWSYESVAQGRESLSSRQLPSGSVVHKPSSWCRRSSKCSYVMPSPEEAGFYPIFWGRSEPEESARYMGWTCL